MNPIVRVRQVQDCLICLDDIITDKITLACSHIFHANCLNSWLNARVDLKSCPVCSRIVLIDLTERLDETNLVLQCHRLVLRLLIGVEINEKYCKIYKVNNKKRITHSNGTQMSLPCRLSGTSFPVKIALKVDDFPQFAQTSYHGTATAQNLQQLYASGWKFRNGHGVHGQGVYSSPSYAISIYNYAATLFFENQLFQVTLECKLRNYRTGYSTLGAYVDDPTWKDLSLPNLQRPTWKEYFNGAPPEFISSKEDVCVCGIIITKINNSQKFRADSDSNSYKDMLLETRQERIFRLNTSPGLFLNDK